MGIALYILVCNTTRVVGGVPGEKEERTGSEIPKAHRGNREKTLQKRMGTGSKR